MLTDLSGVVMAANKVRPVHARVTQALQRTLSMVTAMATELFGSCTNHGECEAVCPKEIPLEFIGRMNHDMIRAAWHRHREPLAIASVVQHPPHEDAH